MDYIDLRIIDFLVMMHGKGELKEQLRPLLQMDQTYEGKSALSSVLHHEGLLFQLIGTQMLELVVHFFDHHSINQL